MCSIHRQPHTDTSAMQTAQPRRTYDHRIKQAILETGDRHLFAELEIPKSTVRSWIHRGVPDAVTSELVDRDRSALIEEVHALRKRTALLAAVVGLLVAMLRTSKTRIDYPRFAEGESKAEGVRLIAARIHAREERIRVNREAACGVCKSDATSAASQLRRPRSRMS